VARGSYQRRGLNAAGGRTLQRRSLGEPARVAVARGVGAVCARRCPVLPLALRRFFLDLRLTPRARRSSSSPRVQQAPLPANRNRTCTSSPSLPHRPLAPHLLLISSTRTFRRYLCKRFVIRTQAQQNIRIFTKVLTDSWSMVRIISLSVSLHL
jgi:hypothetical protein